MFDNGTSFDSNENQNLMKTSIKKEETVKDIKTETLNENISENSEENTAKKSNSSFITVFSDEELYGIKKEIEEAENSANNETTDEKSEEKEDEEEVKNYNLNEYLATKSEVEKLLLKHDYEEIITSMVQILLENEQRALSESSRRNIKIQKFALAIILLSVNANATQKVFLRMMAERLGVTL